jgi:hypothetical protein
MNAVVHELAPVVLFTYRRLHLLRRVVDSLLANPESADTRLIAYSDGPRAEKDRQEVAEVRAYLQSLTGFKSIDLRFREHNLGLAESFMQGISETLERHESGIFLEDDNLLSRHFLAFMNGALTRFADNERVVCITGYSFPIWPKRREPYFIRGAETWSMATWRRGWRVFESDGSKLKRQLDARGLRRQVNRIGVDFYGMLQQQIRGQIDSWGVRWWVSAFLHDMYCLYPHEPVCVSIGYGEGSVHCTTYDPLFRDRRELASRPIDDLPEAVHESAGTTALLRLMNARLAMQRLVRSAWRRVTRQR